MTQAEYSERLAGLNVRMKAVTARLKAQIPDLEEAESLAAMQEDEYQAVTDAQKLGNFSRLAARLRDPECSLGMKERKIAAAILEGKIINSQSWSRDMRTHNSRMRIAIEVAWWRVWYRKSRQRAIGKAIDTYGMSERAVEDALAYADEHWPELLNDFTEWRGLFEEVLALIMSSGSTPARATMIEAHEILTGKKD